MQALLDLGYKVVTENKRRLLLVSDDIYYIEITKDFKGARAFFVEMEETVHTGLSIREMKAVIEYFEKEGK